MKRGVQSKWRNRFKEKVKDTIWKDLNLQKIPVRFCKGRKDIE